MDGAASEFTRNSLSANSRRLIIESQTEAAVRLTFSSGIRQRAAGPAARPPSGSAQLGGCAASPARESPVSSNEFASADRHAARSATLGRQYTNPPPAWRGSQLQITLQVRQLLDLASQHGGFRDMVLATRHAGSPILWAARSGLMNANDLPFADQAAREAGRTAPFAPRAT
jgi:hypothetical protein